MTKERLTEMLNSGRLQDLVENGISETQIREALNVSKKQWIQWKEELPDLQSLMDKADGLGYLEAQATLLKKAKGYYYTEERQEIPIDTSTGRPSGGGKLIKEKKWCPPDEDSLNKFLSLSILKDNT